MRPEASELQKGLGLGHVFCIASGAMISSGLFVLPGMAHKIAGPGVIWSYLMAGLLATTGALSIAELTTAMPKAGGDYFFIMRGFGPGVGTVAGVLSWFSLSLKSAFAIVGMAAFARLIVDLNGVMAGAVLCAGFVGLNVLGVKQAARAQVVLVVGLFLLLGLYIVVGMGQMRSELLIPFAPHGVASVFTATGFVFISYGGLIKVASVAEEVREPGRVIPLGLVLALVAITLLYTLAVMVTSGVVESEVLNGSETPISHGGRALMGPAGYVLMSIGAILAFVSTANAGIMAASRYLLALSRDCLLPAPFSRVNERFHTPHVAILLTGGVIVLSLFLQLEILVKAASTVLILTYVLSCLSVIVLRESGLQNYRPAFQSPVYPWLQTAGIIGFGFVILEMGAEAYFISAGLVLAGFAAYWFYGRERVEKESALLHLIHRIADPDEELVSGALEAELKEIIRERDEIIEDRFDNLIENCPVLEIDDHVDVEEFLERSAAELADRVEMDKETLAAALKEREQESSTAIKSNLAVPHTVVKQEDVFEVLMARARSGVAFSEEAPEVQAIFVLVGSRDQRNFYLSSLAAIAEIAGNKEFMRRWLSAKGKEGLRDVVLLADRERNV
jgi:amino acid transporter/mannitol/fructose-specific phosphotransferase system IIA component (Ntr-type)